MSPSSSTRLAALIAAVTALSILSAGCVAEDKPAHEAFNLVADAGAVQVVPVGSSAAFDWPAEHAVEAEGGHAPAVEIEYTWRADGQADPISETPTASLARGSPGLAVVGLEVATEGTTAADVTGVLFVPPDAEDTVAVFVAFIGEVTVSETAAPFAHLHDVDFEGVPAQWATLDVSHNSEAILPLHFDDIAAALDLEVKATIIVAVKDGVGPAQAYTTGPANFSAGKPTSLRIPVGHGQPEIAVGEAGGSLHDGVTLPAYGDAHRAEGEVSVTVAESQTLPGFGAAAAVAAAVGVASLALVARRRQP